MSKDIYVPSSTRYEQMMYRRAGKSGVLLPEISLGFWHSFGEHHDELRGLEIVHYAFDHGICHFDLANNYGPPNGAAIPQAAEKGVGFIAFSPLAQGLLTDRYLQGVPEDSRMAVGHFLRPEMLADTLVEKLHLLDGVAAQRGKP